VTALLYDDLFLKHDTGAHPECADRLRLTVPELRRTGIWDACARPAGRDATMEELRLVHTAAYIEKVRAMSRGGGSLDEDTPVSRDTFDAALRAVGMTLQGAETVLAGHARNAFGLLRPPGHHAFPNHGSGFCVFNNVAIAARWLLLRGLERILIVDWDIHHGNGTQSIFYDDGRVLYVSSHAFPFYPGTGEERERGVGPGLGYTVNLPVSINIGEEDYMARMAGVLRGPAKSYRPDFVLISAGFDMVRDDPVGGLGLDPKTFASLTQLACEVADACCSGRLLSLLEGGYNLDLLPHCIVAHLKALLEAGA